MKLAPAICFRVTRSCNARCTFCLAPPDGSHPDLDTLTSRVDRIMELGARRIHFCGGEPTIHPGFPRLLAHASSRGAKTSLCTNAMYLPGALLPLLCVTGTDVRISLHGDRAHHDTIVGSGSHALATANLKRLQQAGVPVSIQMTVVGGGGAEVEWGIRFALEHGVRRLSLLPFLPRGRGAECRSDFALSDKERRLLRDLVRSRRRALAGRLDLRWVDFSGTAVPVVETDGRVLLQAVTEGRDQEIYRLP